MTVKNHCGSCDDGLSMDAASGVTPPLLPTLLVALVLGAASLICREPDAPVPAQTTALAARIVSAPATLVAEAGPPPFVPAALAFPRQFPLVVALRAVAPPPAVAQHRPAGPHVASLRRAGPARAPVVEAMRAEPVPSLARAEAPASEGTGDLMPDLALPDLALPFAPALQAVGRARDFVGVQGAAARTQASAFGGAVVDFVGTLR